MRRATTDAGWLLDDNIGLYGVALGFDFCAEHEQGAGYFKEQLGIVPKDFPLGVEDRTQTQVPTKLGFFKYIAKPKDKRFKSTMPCAVLYCTDIWNLAEFEAKTSAEKAAYLDVSFYGDWTAKWYKPELDDFMSSWSSRSGFALHVRGAENVERLSAIHDAFMRNDIALADPSVNGFMRRSLCFVMASKLSSEVRANTLATDTAHKYLHDSAKATGIEELLKGAGKRWYALSPAWRNGPDSELLFFLNPAEQKKYAHGWFTLDELKAWAQESGPVVDGNAIEALLKKDDPDWSIHLLQGLKKAGIGQRTHEKFVWLDDAKTRIGVRLLLSEGTSSKELSDGTYPLEQILPYVNSGRLVEVADAAQASA